MSRIREVVARMAVDPAFAQQVRSHPDEVAQAYGLSPDEIDKLRGLAEAEPQSGPAPLGARLSKSGITGGVLAGFLAGADPMAAAEGGDVSTSARVGFDPLPAPTPNDGLYGAPDTGPVPEDGEYGTPVPNDGAYGIPVPEDGAYGRPDSSPIPNDGAYGAPDTQPIPNDGAYGAPDTQPGPEDVDAKGIVIHGLPIPEDGAYDGPDIQPSGDAVPDGGARGIIIHAAPDPESSDVNVELTPGAAEFAQAFTPSESEQEHTI